MLNQTIRFFLENKLVAFLLLAFFIGWGLMNAPFDFGIAALPRDPVAVDAIPDIGENQQIVFTRWAGRSPQNVEDQITYPLTTALLGLPKVKSIRSTSMFGFSSIYVIFEDGVDFYWSRSRILEKLNSLPPNLLPDGVQPALGPDATALGQIFWYTLEGQDSLGNPTGGWDLQELRSVQDFYVRFGLASADGVAEVASVGGFVKEYQIDLQPDALKAANINLDQVMNAVRNANLDVGAATLEINRVEYFVRGLGYIESLEDLEESVVATRDNVPIRIKDVAKVSLGAATRRGVLDKSGAEAVGGVVVARYGSNPMQVIQNVKAKIADLQAGLPTKTLPDGTTSKVAIVPFYDRTQLINETLGTLQEDLTLQILVTVLVIILMLLNARASLVVVLTVPVAVLMSFIAMRQFGIDANIVSLSGIAIAIGTLVDISMVLTENVVQRIEENHRIGRQELLLTTVFEATTEIASAVLTAVATTVVSFLPVFAMEAAEGKLFQPLAFTKTFALIASIILSVVIVPALIHSIFGLKIPKLNFGFKKIKISNSVQKNSRWVLNGLLALGVAYSLIKVWMPLGAGVSEAKNFLFIVFLIGFLLGFLQILMTYYENILRWCLKNKILFLSIPIIIIWNGWQIWQQTGEEFMPNLDEGSFLLMPTSMPHAGMEENIEKLKLLDMAVTAIPEVETVVGKLGRVESPLDPAPISMYENVINYKTEYRTDAHGHRLRFRTDNKKRYVLAVKRTNGEAGEVLWDASESQFLPFKNKIFFEKFKKEGGLDGLEVPVCLIPDSDGQYFRQWRPHIKTPNDIWDEIAKVTQLPGVTAAPKLQPIETRLVMLQTGMRAPMGIKVKGSDLEAIQNFGLQLETALKQVEGVKAAAVFADRIVGKPYLELDLQRRQIARYGLTISQLQRYIEAAVGGMAMTETVEGRERYKVRIRYPRELRNDPEKLAKILIPTMMGTHIPLGDLVKIQYRQGAQGIKSEDGFLVGYVLFDRLPDYAEVPVVENAKRHLAAQIENGSLTVPKGISYEFAGTYQQQERATKRLSIVLPVALLLIFLILYFEFRSVLLTAMVFTGVFVAFSGGFILMHLYGQSWFLNFDLFGSNLRDLFQMQAVNLSVAVWVGFLALFGIATDDGVLVATYLQQSFKEKTPQTVEEIHAAVVAGGNRRVRPALMTTAATILALLPVLTSTGRGSDVMIPMAIPSFGGMLIQVITMFIVPVLFAVWQEFKLKK